MDFLGDSGDPFADTSAPYGGRLHGHLLDVYMYSCHLTMLSKYVCAQFCFGIYLSGDLVDPFPDT